MSGFIKMLTRYLELHLGRLLLLSTAVWILYRRNWEPSYWWGEGIFCFLKPGHRDSGFKTLQNRWGEGIYD